MIPNLPANTVYAIHLRAASSSGGKDWVGAVTSNCEIHSFWGKTGYINQHSSKGGDNLDLHKIVNQKIHGKDRYQRVDDFTQQNGWDSLEQLKLKRTAASQPIKSPAPLVSKPIINFEKEVPETGSICWDF